MTGVSVTPPWQRGRSPSPIPQRTHHSGREVVIECVGERSMVAIVYPILTRMNYLEWALVMHMNLRAVGLWDVINKGGGDYREDWNALAALLHAVLQEMHAGLAIKESAKEAWVSIRSVRVGAGKVKEANAGRLYREFDDISFNPGECVK
jgi:hypothetical protein